MKELSIGDRKVGEGHPAFMVAELSGNHHQNFEEAVELVHAAKEAGADAVKLQTYTPDTLTLRSDNKWFVVGGKDQPDSWKNRTLYDLYGQAYTPWDWQPKLKSLADKLGIILFSTPFDDSAVDFLTKMDVPCFKVASYEAIHIPLLRKIAEAGKPVIMSIGFADLKEAELAVETLRSHGTGELAVLHCVTAYSDKPDLSAMNLETIKDIRERFKVVSGFSDNNAGIVTPIIAVALAGASVIEKHLTLKRAEGGPDARFSLEPNEFAEMVERIRLGETEGHERALEGIATAKDVEQALGEVHYGAVNEKDAENRFFRPSVWAKKDIARGEVFTRENIRIARPQGGLPPKDFETLLGKRAAADISFATPLSWDLVES